MPDTPPRPRQLSQRAGIDAYRPRPALQHARRLLVGPLTHFTLASHSPSTHHDNCTIRTCTQAPHTALATLPTPPQHHPCPDNVAGQLLATAGRCRRRWRRLAATAVRTTDRYRVHRVADPYRHAYRASLAPPPLADTAPATVPALLKLLSRTNAAISTSISAILCDTRAGDARVRTGTGSRHERASTRFGGGLVARVDRTW